MFSQIWERWFGKKGVGACAWSLSSRLGMLMARFSFFFPASKGFAGGAVADTMWSSSLPG